MYSDRYWEMFNETDWDFDDMAIRTLTKKPARSVRRLIDRINEYKRVKEDQQQGRGRVRLSLRR